MRAIVKVSVVWTLGLAVLFGSSAVSLTLAKQEPESDWVSCVVSIREKIPYCVDKKGNEYRCPSTESQKKDCELVGTQPPGGHQAPVVKPEAAPGGMQRK